LPLYRQSAILAREGIDVDRTTMADWMGHLAWWATPLYRSIGNHVMAAAVLHTDDTADPAFGAGWDVRSPRGSGLRRADPELRWTRSPPVAFYRYSPRPQGRTAARSSGGVQRLHTDAFSGYEALYRPESDGHVRITHVACWAHCRRKLFDVFEATKSPIAEEGLRRIQQLYAIEAEINGKSAGTALAERRRPKAVRGSRRSKSGTWSSVGGYRTKSALGGRLQYALSRWDALTRYTPMAALVSITTSETALLRSDRCDTKELPFLGSDKGASVPRSFIR
jgi:hypothetical protein